MGMKPINIYLSRGPKFPGTGPPPSGKTKKQVHGCSTHAVDWARTVAGRNGITSLPAASRGRPSSAHQQLPAGEQRGYDYRRRRLPKNACGQRPEAPARQVAHRLAVDHTVSRCTCDSGRRTIQAREGRGTRPGPSRKTVPTMPPHLERQIDSNRTAMHKAARRFQKKSRRRYIRSREKRGDEEPTMRSRRCARS